MNVAPKRRRRFALDDLLHPARAFGHPADVISDPDLTVNEKRAILTSWAAALDSALDTVSNSASDAGAPITLAAVLEALRALDQRSDPAAGARLRDWRRRQARRQAIERFRNRRGGDAVRRLPR